MISFDVLGTPAPKGSNRAITIAGKARFVPGGSKVNQQKLKGWDASVRERALEVLGPCLEPKYRAQPLVVELQFRLTRPGGHWRPKGGLKPSAPIAPATKPDIDKLVRSTLDSLTGLVFDDDSRIVSMIVTKMYAAPGQEGALIMVREYSDDITVTYTHDPHDDGDEGP